MNFQSFHRVWNQLFQAPCANAVILIPLLGLLAGCAHNDAWRVPNTQFGVLEDTNCAITKIIEPFKTTDADQEVVTNAYTLFICEFDDAGVSHNPATIDRTIAALQAHLKKDSAIIVTFAHGWKNNAAPDNKNLQLFRYSLLSIARQEDHLAKDEGRNPRSVFGVYIGWRGLSWETPGINTVTVGGRKRAAIRTGTTGAPELIAQLSAVYSERRSREAADPKPFDERRKTRLIAVGHSFGSIVTSESFLPWLSQFVADQREPNRRPADLIVLINPALEALRFKPLHDLAIRRPSPDGRATAPIVASLTATNDTATKTFFPVFQWITTAGRLFRGDEDSMFRKSIGHFEPYRTHNLVLLQSSPDLPNIANVLEDTIESASFFNELTQTTNWVQFLPHTSPTSAERSPLLRQTMVPREIIDGHGLPSPIAKKEPEKEKEKRLKNDAALKALICAISVLVQKADLPLDPKFREERLRKLRTTDPEKAKSPATVVTVFR